MFDSPRQAVLGVTFAALLVTTGVGFVLTEVAHSADLQRGEIRASVVDYETERRADGLRVLVTFRVSNPTPAAVVVTRPGSMDGFVPGQPRRVARAAGAYRPQRVPAGSSARRTEPFVVIEEEDADAVRRAVERGEFRVSGVFNARLRDREFQFETGRGRPADG